MDKCLEQNQGYKDAYLSGKNGQVSDSRIGGIYYPSEKKEKRKEKDSPCSPKAKIKEEERQQYEEQ